MTARINARVQQLQVTTSTKTADNVTVSVTVALHYRVLDRLLSSGPHEGGEGGAPSSQQSPLPPFLALRSPAVHPVVELPVAEEDTHLISSGTADGTLMHAAVDAMAPAAQAMARGARELAHEAHAVMHGKEVGGNTGEGTAAHEHGVWRAHYMLENAESQIKAYVEDTVRSELPKKTLDQAFEAKDDVARAVRRALRVEFQQYGFEVVQALVTDLQPDAKVVAAMNEINASQRLRFAALEKAEGTKILVTKLAEARAEAMFLQGLGNARQRTAVVSGMRECVHDFTPDDAPAAKGNGPTEVMHLLVLTQYLDMLKDVGLSNPTTLFVPHGVGSVDEMQTEVRRGFAMVRRQPH